MRVEGSCRDGGPAVERNGTTPLENERGGRGAATGPRFGLRGQRGGRARHRRLAGRAAGGTGDQVDGFPLDMRGAERIGPPAPDASAYECHDLLGGARLPARRGNEIRLETAGEDQERSIGVLPVGRLHVGKVRVAIEAEEGRDAIIAKPVPNERAPAERPGRAAHRGDGVSGVVLAIAKRALAVLPGFAPVNRRQTHEESAHGQERDEPGRHFAGQRRAALERVVARQVMVKTGVDLPERRDHGVAFRRVQVAARGVGAKCPAAGARLLPGREPE